MKDLSRKDIFQRQQTLVNRLSVYRDGRWQWGAVDFSMGITKSDGAIYFSIPRAFGIVRSTVDNPTKLYKKGNPGDFLLWNPGGYYDIVTHQEYDLRFPDTSRITPTARPLGPLGGVGGSVMGGPGY